MIGEVEAVGGRMTGKVAVFVLTSMRRTREIAGLVLNTSLIEEALLVAVFWSWPELVEV